MRLKQSSNHERDVVVERLREFLRFNYVTTKELACGTTTAVQLRPMTTGVTARH